MDIYNYHPQTGEFLSASKADPDPLEKGRFLIPALATTTAPPTVADNEVAIFANDAWSVEVDFRGTRYWLDDGSEHHITKIGESVPSNGLSEKPTPVPPPPTSIPLNRIQFYAMVELLGKSTEIEAALEAIPDATQKAVAKAKYKHSSRYDRDDPLFALLAPAVGLTDAEIDAAWAQALQIA